MNTSCTNLFQPHDITIIMTKAHSNDLSKVTQLVNKEAGFEPS